LAASDSASTLNQFIRLGCWKDLDLGLSILPVQGDQLNLLRSQLSHIQGLGENLDTMVQGILQAVLVLLVLLLQHGKLSMDRIEFLEIEGGLL